MIISCEPIHDILTIESAVEPESESATAAIEAGIATTTVTSEPAAILPMISPKSI